MTTSLIISTAAMFITPLCQTDITVADLIADGAERPGLIIIDKDIPRSIIRMTSYHEAFHCMDRSMNRQELRRMHRIFSKPPFVYSDKESDEEAAQSFALYMVGREKMLTKERIRFLKKYAKGNRS